MALKEEFEARFSAEYRKKISNPDTRQPSEQNDLRIAQAVKDATAEFPTKVQLRYDADQVAHNQIAAFMVELWLLRYGASPSSAIEKKEKLLDTRIVELRDVTSRGRFVPASTSPYQHSTPAKTSRPEFDEQQFEDFTPRAPGRDEV